MTHGLVPHATYSHALFGLVVAAKDTGALGTARQTRNKFTLKNKLALSLVHSFFVNSVSRYVYLLFVFIECDLFLNNINYY